MAPRMKRVFASTAPDGASGNGRRAPTCDCTAVPARRGRTRRLLPVTAPYRDSFHEPNVPPPAIAAIAAATFVKGFMHA